ncbi:dihydrolipoyllysine-residue acetyltransferase [Marinicella sp. S1101]|uniref:dihydrolipoyllysine-residue acetyltransferase n=1 Tax=Marinicella marina TaxID=2996016 RepID=UPI002260AF50|nr:dihydrolipoyllysine-residue acetyltransferase [Marinicella marina]MCX7554239.1 dihydrolipoyllysine-residue acetyltransferase [Marinicella marina]MDJ1138768.1 dihydrolipoyllysine-residue acetyltransferase [Marinicella marina]
MSDSKTINIPDIGDFSEVEVIEVLVSAGDSVTAEDAIISLESEKATIEVPTPEGGEIIEVLVKEGDLVSEGTPMIKLKAQGGNEESAEESKQSSPAEQKSEPEEDGQDDQPQQEQAKAPQSKAQPAQPKAPPVPAELPKQASGNVPHASPSVRKFARQLGVDLGHVTGTGRKGRITKDDVKNHVKTTMQSGGQTVVTAGFDVPPFPEVDFTDFGEVESEPLSRIQKISGKYLHRNWVRIPHVTQYDEADITELEAFRNENKAEAKEQGFNLTPLAFMVKAMAKALKKFPKFNTSLDNDGENLIYKKYFHIGIAVDTPNGLVVPVIRDCDKKEVFEIAKEMRDVSLKAREGKLAPSDMQGGCISISSLGGIGGTAFTPIINAPEVAILGVSRSTIKPVWNGSEFEPRLMLPLSLSYDHRVIDGADAARFIVYLSSILSDMKKMLL